MAGYVAVLLGLMSALGGGSDQNTDPADQAVLSVQIVNHAHLHEAVLSAARHEASRIYASAGITIVWTADASATRALHLAVLSYSMSDRLIQVEGLRPGVLGMAIGGAGRAYILTERVIDGANRLGVSPGDALGTVIAHELGHLLLVGSGHSSAGVMQSTYEFRNKSARRFTPEQAVSLRQEVERRR